MTREEALEVLLEPLGIKEDWPVGKARIVLLRASEKVTTVLPFLDRQERKRAEKWLEESRKFDYLWD